MTRCSSNRDAARGTKPGSPLYYRRLHADLVDLVADQLGAAAVLTAALWEGACVSAGESARSR